MSAASRAKKEYWDKRLKRDSAAPTLEQFVAELNRELRADPAYLPNVRFLIDVGRSGTTATWEGPLEARALIGRVLQAVMRTLDMPAPFRMEGLGPSTASARDA
jgi:hypothetical protein